MRNAILSVFLLCVIFGTTAKADSGVVVDELLTKVQESLLRVRDAVEEEELPPLQKVTLRLNSSLVKQLNGKISLFIVEFGANVAEEAVQEIKLELGPPRPSDESEVAGEADALADAIVAAAKAVKKAASRQPPLHLRKLTATIKFVVTSDAGGGAKFLVLPVTLDLGGKVKSVATQEAVLVFGE
jgi:hypothetical protein